MLVIGSITACKTVPDGMTEVKTPFSGNKYESNNRWFRATASGESMNMETAKDKALLTAKQRMASQIQTQIKNVSESYKGERQADQTLGEFNERFQSLTREVMSQILVDVNLFDTRTFQTKDKKYVIYVALESRKKVVYQKLKEIAQTRSSLSEADRKYIQQMLDKTIQDLGDND